MDSEHYSDGAHSDDGQEEATSDDVATELELRLAGDDAAQSTFAHTAFDAYFAQNHKPSRTSANIFSNLLNPLTAQGYSSAIASTKYARTMQVPWMASGCDKLFPRLLFELDQGFNLLFYGAGSKREVLNSMALHLNGKDQDVVVINAFNPSSTLKDLLASIETIPAMESHSAPAASSSIDASLKRIQNFFGSPDAEDHVYLDT